ncbi:PAS domain S-box protein [Psychromonas sp.]|uniref:PAS domain S-box protein n=1 Tax=Psychromonas sp. TaxID=1884585 RepID=UPI0035634DF8
MKKLRFSTVILSLVLAVLTVISVILIEVLYYGADKAIQHDIQLTYERDQHTLNSLMTVQFNNIQQISQELSKDNGLHQGLIANEHSHYAHIIDGLLADTTGHYIDAIVVEKRDGASFVFSNASLLGVQLPLKQIVQEHNLWGAWTSILTEVEGKHYSLLHLSLPVIDEQFGEVIGKVHTFVLLNDNYWISNQLQALFGSQAVSFSSGNIFLDGLESQPGQLQVLRNVANNTGKGVSSIENGTLRTHYLRIGNSDNYMVRSLLSNGAHQLLQDSYSTYLFYATTLVIILGAAVMLLIRHLIISALHQLTQYAEQVPQNGSPSPFMGGRFHEFIRVGKAVEKMLLRIRERDKHLSSIIDNSPDLIFIRDLEHNFQLFNQRFVEVLNMKQELLMGKQAEEIMTGDLIAQLREADQKVLRSHRPVQYQMEIETNNGFSTFLMSKFPIIDDQGKLCSIGGIATDITDIKQAEEQLKLAQQVFSETAEAIIVLDNEQNVLSSNKSFIEMSGFDKRDITTAIRSFLSAHPDILLHLQHAHRWQGEGSLLCFDGSSRPVLVSMTHLSSESDEKRYVILFSDITKLKIAEERIEKERMMLRTTADISADLISFKDLEGRYLSCNKAFEKFVGYSELEIGGKTDAQLFSSEQALMSLTRGSEVITSKSIYIGEEPRTYHDGESRLMEIKKVPLLNHQGDVQGLISVWRDITAYHRMQKQLKIADAVFENSIENLVVTDATGTIIAANPACCATSGYSKTELLGSHIRLFASNQQDNVEAALSDKQNWQGDISYRHKSGVIHFGWLEAYVVKHSEELITACIYSFVDLKQSKHVEPKIQFLSKYDPLTGVFNRIALFNRLEGSISRATFNQLTMAVILVDINGFKAVNEQYGHNAGDRVLQEIAGRFKGCVFDKDTVARFGDDEFVIIIDELAHEQDVAIVVQKIADQFEHHFEIAHSPALLSATIGVALFPDDGTDVDTLLNNAESAVLRGKSSYNKMRDDDVIQTIQGNTQSANVTAYHFYTGRLTHDSRQQVKFENELKQALTQEQFELYYQPQYDLSKRQVIAVEAVLYWNHPQRGTLHSDSFSSLAEHSGLAWPIALMMIRQAAIQAVTWQCSAIKFGRITISLTAGQLSQLSLIAELQTILMETKCSREWLEFQFDEGIIQYDNQNVYENLINLSKMGIALTVDKFGEDRPLLSLFEQLSIDKFKVSQHVTEGVSADFVSQAVQDGLLVMARSLGITLVSDSLGNKTGGEPALSNTFSCVGQQLRSKAMKASEATFYLRCNKRK